MLALAAGNGAADPGDVGGEQLAGGVLRQDLDDRRGVLQRRHQLLDADQGDMDLRQGGGQPGIPLVGDQGEAAGLGNSNIGAADSHVGVQISLTQLLAGDLHQVGDVGRLTRGRSPC